MMPPHPSPPPDGSPQEPFVLQKRSLPVGPSAPTAVALYELQGKGWAAEALVAHVHV